ncbi:Glycerol-3-phosphate cytidylyltransferase [Actinomyces bovis]|uniref:Glycerol-3-phosphate cytidylyltransferase n=1 Tax=Actinomyces bovis TaxID=1658 RepID=A0ABY1VPZ8_9ACTO|nr:adenylyltransferase/cytidyltransferase family protein [Actinomyces bovis]SPT53128.1 Glycerol-3-phosphate cytidylyltransferase [Actinomyces bovis]VEG52277.1 Glycerol-3-phosphate cytidylyltransferase [Actinomyces israelii]
MQGANTQDQLVTGYVPGGFDMFHIGHLNILKEAAKRCDRLIVGVATDESLIEMKGRAPMIAFAERRQIVEALGIVDLAVADHSQDKRRAWQDNHFDILFKGTDWQGTAKGERLEAEMAEVGAEVVYLPYTLSTSSTMIRKAVHEVVAATA